MLADTVGCPGIWGQYSFVGGADGCLSVSTPAVDTLGGCRVREQATSGGRSRAALFTGLIFLFPFVYPVVYLIAALVEVLRTGDTIAFHGLAEISEPTRSGGDRVPDMVGVQVHHECDQELG